MNRRLFIRKLIDAVVLLTMVLIFNFFLFRVVDRDPLARYRGRSKVSPAQRAAIIKRFGLERSKWEQFATYMNPTQRRDVGALRGARGVESRRPRLPLAQAGQGRDTRRPAEHVDARRHLDRA